MSDYFLPAKLPVYLQRLEIEYARTGEGLLLSILRGARTLVIPETAYDGWNGGTYGHDVVFYLPREVMARIQLGKQDDYCGRLRSDLNTCARQVGNEHFNEVHLELNDQNDPRFQRAHPFSKKPSVDPDTLSLWRRGYVRLFVSHRDNYKRQAQQLASALEAYGISSFVAHDTIEPMEAWQHEIEKGLATMEIMLAVITDDFHESVWTNQEVGYALAAGVPIIPVKVGRRDPPGFIGAKQALKADVDHPETAAADIYKIIAEKLGQKGRLQPALISAFAAAPDFNEAKIRFQRMDRLVTKISPKELTQIITAFENNPQLHNAIYLDNEYHRLVHFLEKATGRKFVIDGRNIREPAVAPDDEIPF